ncbi:hypothetical protein ACQY0O_000306 [Thecaphora frezii]
MQFQIVLLALVPALAAAAPLARRQGSVRVSCGSHTYSANQINNAINNALENSYNDYPHISARADSSVCPLAPSLYRLDGCKCGYDDYEGFDFSEYCDDNNFEEFPLTANGYIGGSPGADRVVFDPNSGSFCGAITQTGASGNNFVQCNYR